jgi:hypothetical protein
MSIVIPSDLSDVQLAAELQRLARDERDVTAKLIAHLAAAEDRRLHLVAGYPSLFAYCTDVLRLSEHEAYHRILAARTARRYPRIFGMLEDGRLNLTSVRLIAQYLAPENHEELLLAVAGKSRRQIEQLIAGRFPQPDAPTSIRKLPTPHVRTAETALLAAPVAAPFADTNRVMPPVPIPSHSERAGAAPPTARPPIVRPLAPERYQVSFMATTDTIEKLRLAQELLGHVIPSGDVAQVMERALTVLVAELSRRKFAATRRPRSSGAKPTKGRHIPADVKRLVWARDGGRCAIVGTSGRKCGTRRRLEFHHVKPFAEGGAATVANIRLACQAHNGLEADVFYAASRDGRAAAAFLPEACQGSVAGRLLGPGRAGMLPL